MDRKKCKALSVCLAICLAFMSAFSASFAAAEEKTGTESEAAAPRAMDFDTVFQNTWIFYANKTFYYDRGKKAYYGEADYLLPGAESKAMIPVTLLVRLTGIRYEWDADGETLRLEANGKNASLRIGEDCVTVNGAVYPLAAPMVRKESRILISPADVLQHLGFYTYSEDSLSVVSADMELPLGDAINRPLTDRLEDLFYDYIVNSDFETTVAGNTYMLPERSMPEGWSFYNWATPSTPDVDAGISTEEHYSGSNSAYVAAVHTQMAGFQSPMIPLNKDAVGYQLEFKIKKSEDYAGSIPQIMVAYYKNGSFVSSSFKGGIVYDSERWTENTYVISQNTFRQIDADTFRISLQSYIQRTPGVESAGRIYFDDVKISLFTPNASAVRAALRPNAEGSWYVLGDEIVYKALDNAPLEHLKGITGVVYNSYEEPVLEKYVGIDEMLTKGWRWTPEEVGFYDVRFYGVQHGGENRVPIINPFVVLGTNTTKEHIGVIERQKHNLVVTARETKPIEERNQHIYFSDKGARPVSFKLADLVGFSGVRVHWIPWGPYGSDPLCIQPERDSWNWGFMDERISGMRSYGYNIIGNVLFTPKWASPEADRTGINAYGMYGYSIYAPANMDDWNNFLTKLVTRYKDDIKGWEIWNEPSLPGSSAFWNDTPENYTELLKNAYATIKGIQPDSTVYLCGGGMAYLSFFRALYHNPEIGNYYDALASHGRLNNMSSYASLEEKNGFEPKPYSNLEAHYMLLNAKNSPKVDYTEPQNTMRMFEGYFYDIKNGAKDMALFRVYDPSENEYDTLEFYQKEQLVKDNSSLFRHTPYIEPRHMACALHTFFELMGKELKYQKEFLFNDNSKAVLFDNDGAPLLALWSERGNNFRMDESFIDCMTDETVIYDWEGRVIRPEDYMLTGSTMYFITGLDQNKLGKLEGCDNLVLANEQQRRSITEEPVPAGVANAAPIFDKNTFAVSSNVVWNENDWVWVKGTDEANESFSAKYAVSVSSEGVYLMVDVTDDKFVENDSAYASHMWQYDSIQMALDAGEDVMLSDRVEFQIGMLNGKPTIYKEATPYIGGNLIDNWTKQGEVLPVKYMNIETRDGGVLYKIFLPNSELYPFAYVGGEATLRMSILVNDNDGSGRKGYLEWASGIGASKDPALYGKIPLGK